MATRGFPAINDPRQAPREVQEVVRAIRQRLQTLEALVNTTDASLAVVQRATAILQNTPPTPPSTPANSVQFNAEGQFAGSPNLTYDYVQQRLSVVGSINLAPNEAREPYISGDVLTQSDGLYAYVGSRLHGPYLDAEDLVAGTGITITPLSGGGLLFTASGGSSFDVDTILTDANGDVISDANGNVLVEA